jgi:hypothetical protein
MRLGLAWVLVGCTPLPQTLAERALYLDMRRIAETRQRTDWIVDRREVEEALPAAIQSVCAAPADAPAKLRRWIDRRVRAEGGPAREAYERAGRDLGAASEILTIERAGLILDRALAEPCPFWIERDPEFAGVQEDTDRFVVYVETVGSGEVSWSRGAGTLGGAGAGRLLPAYGLGSRATLMGGAEVGGGGALAKDGSGGIRASFAAAVPLLLRLQDVTRFWDLELAGTARIPEGLDAWRPGFRIATGAGISALRVSNLLPYFALWAGFELLPAHGGDPAVAVIRVGSRFGLDWDP